MQIQNFAKYDFIFLGPIFGTDSEFFGAKICSAVFEFLMADFVFFGADFVFFGAKKSAADFEFFAIDFEFFAAAYPQKSIQSVYFVLYIKMVHVTSKIFVYQEAN